MFIDRSEMFLGKTDQSQIDCPLCPFDNPPLAKHHIQIPVKQQIKHDNLDLVFGHRMATGPTPWGLLYTFQDMGLKPPLLILFAVLEVWFISWCPFFACFFG